MTPRTVLVASTAATIVGALLTAIVPAAQSRDSHTRTIYVRTSAGEMGGGVADVIEAVGDGLPRQAPTGPRSGVRAASLPYTFFPQAGTPGQDLFVSNYVDLAGNSYDITQPGLDYECTAYSYRGHDGHDSVIEGFREQAIGVPVFAALDGTVVDARDGQPDQETTNLQGRPANYVILSHGAGMQTRYFHFKTGSVAVRTGQRIMAGTQIGLTGSSGNSSWPHLHFTSVVNGAAIEPSAGPCRPGASSWVSQPVFRRDTYMTTFTFGDAPFVGDAAYPYDDVARRGTYQIGTTVVYFRFALRNLPAQSTYRLLLVRPDGTPARDTAGSFNNANFYRHAWYWFSRGVTLNTPGTWTLHVYINDSEVSTAPFVVLGFAEPAVNHEPLALAAVSLEPEAPRPADVPTCRVTPTSLYRRDPDYDLVRYRYRWFAGDTLVREVVSAGLADVIPSGSFRAGVQLRCEVTPMDEELEGPTSWSPANTGRPS